MQCLWLSRSLPFPLTAGDRIYTRHLAGALAAAGATVTFLGLDPGLPAPAIPGLLWHRVPGGPRPALPSLLSPHPLVGRRHQTAAYVAALRRLARERAWDAVVIDNYAMGWTLRHRGDFRGNPAFVYVAHNHEEEVARQLWRQAGAPAWKRAYFFQNYLKTRAAERALLRAADFITTITDADARAFAALAPEVPQLLLTPGYAGPRRPDRRIDATSPRSLLLFGSFHWAAKQASLLRFLEACDAPAAEAGLEIRVVGDAPPGFVEQVRHRFRAARMTGFVADPEPLMDARLAVLAEPIGGGFKLKLLDYLFRRIPVAALECCAEGLPPAVRSAMILRPDLDTLVPEALRAADQPDRLDALQRAALAAAEHAFDWKDRGVALWRAIDACRAAWAAQPAGSLRAAAPFARLGA